jgi:Ca2+-binding RTX toxin-like protein
MRGVIRKGLGVCAGLLLLAPASAFAGTASVDNGLARYDAAFGEVNDVSVYELPGFRDAQGKLLNKLVVFVDTGAQVTGDGCAEFSDHSAACLVDAESSRAQVQLGNKNDRLEPVDPNISVGFSAEGGFGDDVLIGTHNRDVLDGESGNDTLRGRNKNDALQGGIGNDDLRGDAGPDDALLGGAGDDKLDVDDNASDDDADCGDGFDFVRYNPGDLITDCEQQLQD